MPISSPSPSASKDTATVTSVPSTRKGHAWLTYCHSRVIGERRSNGRSAFYSIALLDGIGRQVARVRDRHGLAEPLLLQGPELATVAQLANLQVDRVAQAEVLG